MALSSLQNRARTRDLSQQGARLPRSPGNACHPGPRGHLRTPERRVAGREAARRTGPAAEVRPGTGRGAGPMAPPLRAAALCLLGRHNAKTVPMGENRMRGTGQTARQPSPELTGSAKRGCRQDACGHLFLERVGVSFRPAPCRTRRRPRQPPPSLCAPGTPTPQSPEARTERLVWSRRLHPQSGGWGIRQSAGASPRGAE